MYKPHTICRACGHTELIPVFDLGIQFPANNFTFPADEKEGAAPLKVLFCERCTLAQLSVVVSPVSLYSNYSYVTSKSDTMKAHFRVLWSAIQDYSPAKNVIEIGSNDGEFLAFCKENGAENVYGYEPARNLADIANARGIRTGRDPFGWWDWDLTPWKPDLIVARHVFCHLGDWRQFVIDLENACRGDCLVVIEVPYVLDTLHRVEFDQVYHEHLSFLSLKAMAALLNHTPFTITRVMGFQIHGGTIAIFIKRRDADVDKTFMLDAIRDFASENITLRDWKLFDAKAKARIANLATEVRYYLHGKKVVGFGASAKSSVWIQACGFTKQDIAFICDNTPQKQGKLSPGTDIPIVPESELTRDNADVAILFAWNFADEIKRKHQKWIDGGGQFILPHEL